jgi:hypothetical protein
LDIIFFKLYALSSSLFAEERGRKGSTGVMRLGSHVVVPSPRKKAETNTNANNELALAA